MTRKAPTNTERITGLREAIEAANGDWHQVTALWSVQADLDWLLSRAERADMDSALAAQVPAQEERLDVERLIEAVVFLRSVIASGETLNAVDNAHLDAIVARGRALGVESSHDESADSAHDEGASAPVASLRGADGHLHSWGEDRLIAYCQDGCDAWRAKP